MLNLLLFLFALIAFNFFENFIRFVRCIKLIKRIETAKSPEELVEHRQAFLNLTYFVHDKAFLKTIYSDDDTPPAVKSTNTRAEFPFFDTEISAIHMLQESKGFYRSKLWDVLNPLQWIRKFISLPSNILSYLGIPSEKVFSKLLNIAWRIVLIAWWFVTPYAETYRDIFNYWIESFFK